MEFTRDYFEWARASFVGSSVGGCDPGFDTVVPPAWSKGCLVEEECGYSFGECLNLSFDWVLLLFVWDYGVGSDVILFEKGDNVGGVLRGAGVHAYLVIRWPWELYKSITWLMASINLLPDLSLVMIPWRKLVHKSLKTNHPVNPRTDVGENLPW